MPKKKSVNGAKPMKAVKAAKPVKAVKPLEFDDSPAVSALIESMLDPARAMVFEIRKTIMKANPKITEGIKWNSPSFYWNGWFATVNARKGTEVMLVLHHGPAASTDSKVRSAVSDPSQLLKWHSADRASITFTNLKMLQESQSALAAIVKEWATYHSALPNRNPANEKNQAR